MPGFLFLHIFKDSLVHTTAVARGLRDAGSPRADAMVVVNKTLVLHKSSLAFHFGI